MTGVTSLIFTELEMKLYVLSITSIYFIDNLFEKRPDGNRKIKFLLMTIDFSKHSNDLVCDGKCACKATWRISRYNAQEIRTTTALKTKEIELFAERVALASESIV